MDFKRFLKNTSILVFLFIFASTLSAQEITLVGHVYSGTSSNNALIPVEGAQISIALDSVPEGTMTTSNEEGYYELPFEWNWDGPIPISCQAEGYEFYYSVFIPNSNSAEFEYDILLTPISGDIITALQGRVWEGNGCLGGPMGCPIENAHIEAVPLNSPTDVVYTANSDPLGFYYMELPAGAYVATCSAEGWATESTVLEIGSGGVIYDFYLPEEGADSEVYFSGIVWGEVGPMLPAFEPIAEAAVILYGGFTGGVLAETLTNDNGYFEFSDVVWSATAVSIHADGFIDQEFGIYDLCSDIDPTNTECFPLEYDFYMVLNDAGPVCGDLSDFNFGSCEMIIGYGWNGEECTWFSGCGTVDEDGVDHAGSFFDSMEECNATCADVVTHGTLAGEVFYQWGDAIELVTGALIQMHSSGGFIFETETNENGFYLIEEIPHGNYAVTCTVYTGETMTQEVEIIVGASAIVDFWFGEPWYETAIMGMIYDANHENQVVHEAHIMAHGSDGVIIETYSMEGFYWLSLPAVGNYLFTLSADGYFDLDATIYVQGIIEHNFYLTPIDDGMDPQAGDINDDGEVNVLDVVALVNFVIFIEEPSDNEFWAGDLNQDNSLNVLDVVLMVNIILGDPALPEDCYIIPEVGPCDGICPTYYFNQDTNHCEEFITGCCGVEAFDTMQGCIDACE
mgnify:CR=1 FL=1